MSSRTRSRAPPRRGGSWPPSADQRRPQTQQIVRQIPNGGELGGQCRAVAGWPLRELHRRQRQRVPARSRRRATNRRLTHTADWGNNGYSNVPVVSPDGRQVAYVWYIHPENAAEVRLISTDGVQAAPTVALRTRINEVPYKLAWMPDGRQLQAIRRPAGSDVADRHRDHREQVVSQHQVPRVASAQHAQPVPGRPVSGLRRAGNRRRLSPRHHRPGHRRQPGDDGGQEPGQRLVPAVVAGRLTSAVPERPHGTQRDCGWCRSETDARPARPCRYGRTSARSACWA